MRGMLLAVAIAALACGAFVAGVRWFLYPHIKLNIINDTSSAVHDVRVTFSGSECTAERIGPGGSATADIQGGGETLAYITYRVAQGALTVDKPFYNAKDEGVYERGYLYVYLTNKGMRVVDRVYTFPFEFRPWFKKVPPKGQMIAR
jgi:hypothetical protein